MRAAFVLSLSALALPLALPLALVLACSGASSTLGGADAGSSSGSGSGSGGSSGSGGGGSSGSSSGGSSGAGSGGSSGSGSSSGGGCNPTPPDGGTCNSLQPQGPLVALQCSSGAMPTASGGAPVDGTYVLTSSTFFGSPCTPGGGQDRDTWLVCGSTWQTAQEHLGQGGPVSFNAYNLNVTPSGTSLQLDVLCGLPQMTTLSYPYDATPTSLTLYVGGGGAGSGRVDVFTRQ